MAEGRIRQVCAEEAECLFARLPQAALPATLHPCYVTADAARHPALLKPTFVCFELQGEHWLHGMHVTEVPGTKWRDASSPYGYGGPVASTADVVFAKQAWEAYGDWMRGQRIVVEYVRFHPLLGNDSSYGGQVLDNRQVVCMDITGPDYSDRYAPRLRQTVNKAVKAGLRYRELPLRTAHREFGEFHREAMREMDANSFYVFDDEYFERLAAVRQAVVGLTTREGDETWLAAALFLDGRGIREYHLAATNEAGRKLGASSFTLHEGAAIAQRVGLGELFLGGGTNAQSDNPLFFFKAGFSPDRLTYRTGWTVFDMAAYDELKAVFPSEWNTHPDRPIFYRKV